MPAIVTAAVTVGDTPIGVAFDGSYIWVANFSSDNVSKIIPFCATERRENRDNAPELMGATSPGDHGI